MKVLFDIICLFYLLPTALLLLYCVYRQVQAERNGWVRPGISMVCFVPVLNLLWLVFLSLDMVLMFLEYIDKWIKSYG